MVSPELRQAKTALVAKKRSLKEELKRIEEAIESLDRVIGPSSPKAGRRGSVKEAIAEVLEENAAVMHADEILEAVKRRGVELSSRDPKATVVTALIRLRDAGDVEALGRNRWQWKGRADLMEALRVSVESARARRATEREGRDSEGV